jgi:hypothetical protein
MFRAQWREHQPTAGEPGGGDVLLAGEGLERQRLHGGRRGRLVEFHQSHDGLRQARADERHGGAGD